MRKNLRAWVKIARARLPDVVKQAILDRFPDPNDALVADLSELSNAARKAFAPGMTLESHADAAAVDKDCSWLGGGEWCVIGLTEAVYPPLLRQIPDPPLVLYTAGDHSLLGWHGLAIVGSRDPTPIG
ncbi:MAG: DNA-processing protein DprA, partial [Pseudomonadota bacterium]|nr:DNA-processing protein DprA [Pseudomonadota bacterium]